MRWQHAASLGRVPHSTTCRTRYGELHLTCLVCQSHAFGRVSARGFKKQSLSKMISNFVLPHLANSSLIRAICSKLMLAGKDHAKICLNLCSGCFHLITASCLLPDHSCTWLQAEIEELLHDELSGTWTCHGHQLHQI